MGDSYRTYYPVFLDVKDRPCLVVGGGTIGLEKAKGLVEAGAHVTVVSPEVGTELAELIGRGEIVWRRREFLDEDLVGQFVVFGATDDPEVNRTVSQKAEALGRLANAVDDPDFCNFILAALVTRGPMTIAVSSAGCSPALAQRVRNRIATEILDPGIGELAELLGSWRGRVKQCIGTYQERKSFWEAVLASPAPKALAAGGVREAEEIIEAQLGKCCSGACRANGNVCPFVEKRP